MAAASNELRTPLLSGRKPRKEERMPSLQSSGSGGRASGSRGYWKRVSDHLTTNLQRSSSSRHSLTRRPPHFTRSWLLDLLEGRPRTHGAAAYQRLLALVALLSVASFTARTSAALAEAYGTVLAWVDVATASLSLADYLLRLVAAPEMKCYRVLPPWLGRARHFLSLYGMLDALSIFPAFLAIYKPWMESLPDMWVRIFRLLTLLRTRRHTQVMSTVIRVLYANRRILSVSACMCFFTLLWTSAVLWVVASASPDHSEAFPNMLSALYMAVLMLTGAGMPEGDLPGPMRAMVAVTALLSVAFFAIPAAMLTWGFEGEAERLARQELRQERLRRLGDNNHHHNELSVAHVAKRLDHKRPQQNGSNANSSGHRSEHLTSSSSEGNSMAEYLQGLGGGEDPEDLMDEALSFFESCDPHGNSPLLPRAQQQAEELQRGVEHETLRHDLRETAYTILMKLPARIARAQHRGIATMTTDLHEEVRLRRFAQTARAHLRPAAPAGAEDRMEAGEDAGAAAGQAREEEASGAGSAWGTPCAPGSQRGGDAAQATAEGQEALLRALAAEVSQLRRLVDERLRPPPPP